MKLSELKNIVRGEWVGDDAEFTRVVIDSRIVQAGDCFFAIKGEFFDGHDFIASVEEKNAAVVIVDREIQTRIPQIRVANTHQALKVLAQFYRENTAIPVAAITGSCGKTTVRALLENILKQQHAVFASQKSFNNDIGLPLTLLQLKPSHDVIVLEIGTNHPGEIAALTAIAKPTVAAVTLAAPVHIAHFETVEAIAREKGALFEGLASDGIAVMNADDLYADLWKTLAGDRRVITFGRNKKSDVMARDVEFNVAGQATFNLLFSDQSVKVTLPLLGEHNVMNALCASAMALALNVPLEEIKIGLETAQPEYGRLIEKKGLFGATVIDDSYNANPLSVKAAITLLLHRSSHSILVLGDMGELGDQADFFHSDIGRFAKSAGLEKIFCYGKYSIKTAHAFGKNAQHFENHQALIDALKKSLTSDTTVLVKGSRSMQMEKVVEALISVSE